MDIRSLVQKTLDEALGDANVRAHWLRKSKTNGEEPDEYIVYTLDGDTVGQSADNKPLTREANVAIQYYYRDTFIDTAYGRQKIKDREDQISAALLQAGFSLPDGSFDAGEIDDIGFGTIIFDCSYWRVL